MELKRTVRMIHTHTGRKERENPSFYNNSKGSFGRVHQLKQPLPMMNHNTTSSSPVEPAVPAQSNRLLAGYMAYEFLTRGTLFGQRFDPARPESVPVSAAEPKRKSNQTEPDLGGKRPKLEPNRSYTEVAELLKGDGGAHIPGVVNPTQLSRWIQM